MIYDNLIELLEMMSRIKAREQFITEIISRTKLNYLEFFELVQKRAMCMKKLGLKCGNKVGLMYKNSLEFMVDFFAILVNHSVVVPINPNLKDRELEYIFQDSNLQYIITEKYREISKIINIIENNDINGEIKFLKIANQTIVDSRTDNLAENTAIILYTSGSTGKAKGVMLTHSNLLAEMRYIKDAHELTSNDRVLCVLPWFHINGLVITMLTPLLVGHEIVIAEKFSQHNFWKWVDDYQITWFSGVPTIYSYLLSEKSYCRHNSLRFARSASSPLPIKILQEFEKRYCVPVIESYGMTEGGSQLTTNPIPPKVRKPGSVGIPYGVKMRIINDAGEECREGESGEVQFSGANITEGYYKKINETGQAFDKEWLKTGDVGFFDEEGYLFLIGRKKELINRAGEKFAPKEIEEILYQYKGIKMAAAVGIPDDTYGEEVIAFCVSDSKIKLSKERIIEFCKKYLADYKVPKDIIFLRELPVGGNGKIQRLKLIDEYKREEI